MYPSAVSILFTSCLHWMFGLLFDRATVTIPASHKEEEPLEKEKKIKSKILKFSILQALPFVVSFSLAIAYT